jgi:hypothetical protein
VGRRSRLEKGKIFMSKAVVKQTEKGTIIKCVRGPVSKMSIIVKNKTGEEFYCPLQKKIFEKMAPNCSVEIFEKEGLTPKKYMREYLELVSETEWNK